MPKAKVLWSNLRYLNRMLVAGDEVEVLPGDVRWITSRGRAELVSDEPARRGPGRPAKAKAEPEPDPTQGEPGPTRSELLAKAEELGVELPAGYVHKDKLAELVAAAEADAEGRF